MRIQRFSLRDENGNNYLSRKGLDTPWFGILLHTIDAPDPGKDLHDHPWWFISIILSGGYLERRAKIRDWGKSRRIGYIHSNIWRRWSVHLVRLNEAHRIAQVDPGTKTLVIRGPRKRRWGFYPNYKFVDHDFYSATLRGATKVET